MKFSINLSHLISTPLFHFEQVVYPPTMSESSPEEELPLGSQRDEHENLIPGPRRSVRQQRNAQKEARPALDAPPPSITQSQPSNTVPANPSLTTTPAQDELALQNRQAIFDGEESSSSSNRSTSGPSLATQGAVVTARSEREHYQHLWSIFSTAEEEDLAEYSDFRKLHGLPAVGCPPDPDQLPMGDASPLVANGTPSGRPGETEDEVMTKVAATPVAPTGEVAVHDESMVVADPPLDSRPVPAAVPAHGECSDEDAPI